MTFFLAVLDVVDAGFFDVDGFAVDVEAVVDAGFVVDVEGVVDAGLVVDVAGPDVVTIFFFSWSGLLACEDLFFIFRVTSGSGFDVALVGFREIGYVSFFKDFNLSLTKLSLVGLNKVCLTGPIKIWLPNYFLHSSR